MATGTIKMPTVDGSTTVSPTTLGSGVTHYATHYARRGDLCIVDFNIKLTAEINNAGTVMAYTAIPAPVTNDATCACTSASSSSYVGMAEAQNSNGGLLVRTVGKMLVGNYIRGTLIYFTA